MFDLYRAELRRFRRGATAFAAAHLVILAPLQDSLEITAGPLGVHLLMLCLYALAGLGLAVFQFGSYSQPSRWIWLLHRPLHRGRILAALVLAALTLDILAVALPPLLVLAAQAHTTQRVIDHRHYLGAACLALATLAGWLAGGWVMLHRSRWAFLVFVLPLILCLHLATAGSVVALWVVCDAVLALLLYTVFLPHRDAGAGTAAAVPGALMLTLGFYAALLTAGTLLFAVSQLLPGVPATGAGTYSDTLRLTVPERIRLGLSASAAPDAAAWRAGLSRATTQAVTPLIRGFAVPGVISSRGMPVFYQGEDRWTFSEDSRMYRGANLRTGVAAGVFGTGGQGDTGPFDAQPVPARDNRGGSWMVDAHTLFAIDGTGRILHRAFSADAGEWLASGITWAGPDRLLLTDRRLVLFDPGAPALVVRHAVALPLPLSDLGAVDTARVTGGTLVSLLYGYRQDSGGPAQQHVYLFAADGAREVAYRAVPDEHPALYAGRDWWSSPALHAVAQAIDGITDNGAIPGVGNTVPAPHPGIVRCAALAAMLLAGAGALWRVRRTTLPPRARLLWCLACFTAGLPAFLALLVMAPPRPSSPLKA